MFKLDATCRGSIIGHTEKELEGDHAFILT
jgi:hypothetical protein